MKNYWLIKSEADCYSIDEMKKDKQTPWTGVRNYQARNFMKSMKKGDLVIFYHSGANPPAAVGIVEVTKESYPDPTQFAAKNEYFDPKASKEKPIWFLVDFKFKEKFKKEVSLPEIKINPRLRGVSVARRGNRLSVMPISQEHFEVIKELGNKN